MTKSILSMSPIDFLVRRKFRMPFTPPPLGASASEALAYKSLMKDIDDYRRELFTVPPNELQDMHYRELLEFRKEQEAELFYNMPLAQADYKHWGCTPYWTLDEAVSLTFGKDPRIVAPDKFLNFSRQDDFVKKYLELNDCVHRAKNLNLLTDPVLPSVYIIWAKQSGYEIPSDLEAAVVDNAAHVTNWKLEYDELKRGMSDKLKVAEAHLDDVRIDAEKVINSKNSEIERLKASLEKNAVKSLSTRERDTLLKLLIGMAVGGICV